GKHGKSYAHWFVEHAGEQERVAEMFVAPVRAMLEGKRPHVTALRQDDDEGIPLSGGHALAVADESPLRGAYRIAYRMAWGVRRAVKPLTTQAFRHRIRHALLRKAYF